MKKTQPLITVHQYHDINETFDPFLDTPRRPAEVTTLGMLHDSINQLVTLHGRDAELSVEINGDDYYSEWNWVLVTSRLETVEEQKLRLKKEQDAIKSEQKRKKKIEDDEKKLYLKLKKKYEGK